jgi:hypothetical protein
MLYSEVNTHKGQNQHSGGSVVSLSISEGTQSSTLAIANPSIYSSSPVESLDVQALQLLRAGLSESTRKSCQRSWDYSTALKELRLVLSHYPT